MRRELTSYSKLLSLVLRHDPSAVGLSLDEEGWIDVDVLLAAVQRQKPDFTRDLLFEVVETNEKRRFAFSPDGQRIRASQGHSIGVSLGLEPIEPPEILYHGTAERNLVSIFKTGLQRRERDYVHLSVDEDTAHRVGIRHGKPVILTIRSKEMHETGHPFYLSENGVWLTVHVPPEFLIFPHPHPVE